MVGACIPPFDCTSIKFIFPETCSNRFKPWPTSSQLTKSLLLWIGNAGKYSKDELTITNSSPTRHIDGSGYPPAKIGFLKVWAFNVLTKITNMIFCQYEQKLLLNEFNVLFNDKF